MLEVASDAKIICGTRKASMGYLHFNQIIPCRNCNIDESEKIAVITNTTTLAVNDTVTKSLSRIEQMISSYDSWVFKSPKELVRDIADIINDNVDIAPYPIRVQVKPTSVYILIHLNDDEIATIDDAEFDAAIEEYVDWIRSLPEVGRVKDEQIYDYFRYSKRFPSRWPHLPIKVLPAVQR